MTAVAVAAELVDETVEDHARVSCRSGGLSSWMAREMRHGHRRPGSTFHHRTPTDLGIVTLIGSIRASPSPMEELAAWSSSETPRWPTLTASPP
jgi:hypothetical protein